MSYKPKRTLTRLLKVLEAWQTLAADKIFGAMTLAQFEAKVERSRAARRRIAEIKILEAEAIVEREAADGDALRAVLFVVAGVISEPTAGINSGLYEAMGYIRKSMRKTGLTRKRNAAAKIQKSDADD